MKMNTLIFKGKPVNFVCTDYFNEKYGGLEMILYIKIIMQALRNNPRDMYVFSCKEQGEKIIQSCRCAGYSIPENEHSDLDEKTIVWKDESLQTDTFWCKIDDHGDQWITTFLFPDEY